MREKVPKIDNHNQVVVNLRLEHGSVSPAQKQAARHFWQKLITEAKREAAK